MPDIVLLSKIYYACQSFEEVQFSLGVSKEAIAYRLIDLLREYHLGEETEIRRAVDEYIDGQNANIHHYFHKINYDGAVYAVVWNGKTYIKRVYREEQGLRLVSINPKYKNVLAPYEDEPRVVGLIVGNFMPLKDYRLWGTKK